MVLDAFCVSFELRCRQRTGVTIPWGPLVPDTASDRAIGLAHDRDLVLSRAMPTASSGGRGAGASFRADPPDDVVGDA
jgi:hypothetical protein